MICIQISECNLAQKPNFSCKQQDFFIYIDNIIVINIHDMQNEEFLIWIFFSNFAWMLQLAVVRCYECVKDQTLINSQWTLASSLRID